MSDVCLVQMPYTLLYTPSLALGLLKAELVQEGISCRVVYGDLLFSKELGLSEYLDFSRKPIARMFGEMSWASAAWGSLSESEYTDYIRTAPNVDENERESQMAALKKVSSVTMAFVDKLAHDILKDHPILVGCSSSFQQNNASFALLRRIRELDPTVVTVMGGGNCACGAGAAIVREVPWVDYVFSGDGDQTVPDFCALAKRFGKEIPLALLPKGVQCRANTIDGEEVPYVLCQDLDSLPVPDFSDYFAYFDACGLRGKLPVYLVAEGSRGCWWNEKKGCTFCGLCVKGDAYRVKSTGRFFDEIMEQSARYGMKQFFFTDCILSPKHMKELLPKLNALEPEDRPVIISEVKSNMTRDMMYRLRGAGFEMVQPGIESLQDNLLLLMNKGNTAIRHVELLKNARSCGMELSWNLLVGFPGEKEEWIDETAALIPLLTHLPPPNWATHIIIQRYNYYQRHPQTIGYPIRPMEAYSFAYAHNEALVRELAYNFEPAGEALRPGYYDLNRKGESYRRLNLEVQRWQDCYLVDKERFQMMELPDRLELLDLRSAAVRSTWVLQGLERDVYLYCEKPRTMEELQNQFGGAVGSVADKLCENRLSLRIGNQVLSLATRADQRPSRLPV